MSPEPPFIVRAYPRDASEDPADSRRLTLEVAVEEARKLAWSPAYRAVAVLDGFSMVWAQFNMLWSVPSEHR